MMKAVFNLAHAQPVRILIVLLSLLCTWPTPTVLLEYTKLQLQLAPLIATYYLHGCEQLHAVKYGI